MPTRRRVLSWMSRALFVGATTGALVGVPGLAADAWAQAKGKGKGKGTVTVYVTKTGSKYHRESCRHRARSKIAMSLEEAARRYAPCGTCRPPTP